MKDIGFWLFLLLASAGWFFAGTLWPCECEEPESQEQSNVDYIDRYCPRVEIVLEDGKTYYLSSCNGEFYD